MQKWTKEKTVWVLFGSVALLATTALAAFTSSPCELGSAPASEESAYAHVQNDGTVDAVVIINSDTLAKNGGWYVDGAFKPCTEWRRTSTKGTTRKNYAGIGSTYDTAKDAFIPRKPYSSWKLNSTTYRWEAPVKKPNDGVVRVWNEKTTSWEAL